MKLKYLIIDDTLPVVFHEGITHEEIGKGKKVTSAGFCYVDTDIEEGVGYDAEELNDLAVPTTAKIVVSCFGESVSLGIKSDPNDSKKIEALFSEY